MRKAIVWLGVIVVVIGVFLPWVTVSSKMGGGSVNGLDVNEGPIQLGIAVVGILVSFFAGKSNASARLIGILLLIGGIAVMLMTLNSISSTGEARSALRTGMLGDLARSVDYSIKTSIGAYITLAGGALLGLGGLTYLIGGEDD